MEGVGISIIKRPRPLPGHDTPNPTQHPYTLKCEESHTWATRLLIFISLGFSLSFHPSTISPRHEDGNG